LRFVYGRRWPDCGAIELIGRGLGLPSSQCRKTPLFAVCGAYLFPVWGVTLLPLRSRASHTQRQLVAGLITELIEARQFPIITKAHDFLGFSLWRVV